MTCFETPFLYPDGSSVDLFVMGSTISDSGQTAQWVTQAGIGFKPSERVLECYGIRRDGGKLTIRDMAVDGLVDATLRLGQACVSVAWMAIGQGSQQADEQPASSLVSGGVG